MVKDACEAIVGQREAAVKTQAEALRPLLGFMADGKIWHFGLTTLESLREAIVKSVGKPENASLKPVAKAFKEVFI